MKKIKFKEPTSVMQIVDEYIEEMVGIPTDEAKEYIRNFKGTPTAKFASVILFAGICWALKHPETLEVEE